jgi:hypothetical protein
MRRTPRQARFLGLWTASWLFALLLALLLRVGDLRVQWPALLVPGLWGLVALARGRRSPARRPPGDDDVRRPADDGPYPPPTRELPWLPEVPRDRREE